MRQPQPDTHTLPERPLASVMVPVYNVLPYLGRAPAPSRRPTATSEVIAVDDGSTDGSDELYDEYARRDGRLTLR